VKPKVLHLAANLACVRRENEDPKITWLRIESDFDIIAFPLNDSDDPNITCSNKDIELDIVTSPAIEIDDPNLTVALMDIVEPICK
jgi:hypothetical protein